MFQSLSNYCTILNTILNNHGIREFEVGTCDIFSRSDKHVVCFPSHKTNEPSIRDAFKFCRRKFIINAPGKWELNDN
jgi:hypothetical protein